MPIGVRRLIRGPGNGGCGIPQSRPRKSVLLHPTNSKIKIINISKVQTKFPRKLWTLSGHFVIVLVALTASSFVAIHHANAKPLSLTEFESLAARCAPYMPITTLEAVARTESGLDPLALHDNTTGNRDVPANLDDAIVEAGDWLARGDSVDIGLMQINAANLPALRMTIDTALDPCASLAGGAAVLQAAYGGGKTPAEQQVALLMALSRYNTGSPFAGIMNGYARTVMTNAVTEALPVPVSDKRAPANRDPNAPPSWNISTSGAYAQIHGASWLIDLAPPPRDEIATINEPPPSVQEQEFTEVYNEESPISTTTR